MLPQFRIALVRGEALEKLIFVSPGDKPGCYAFQFFKNARCKSLVHNVISENAEILGALHGVLRKFKAAQAENLAAILILECRNGGLQFLRDEFFFKETAPARGAS